jgi:hypothetical protein
MVAVIAILASGGFILLLVLANVLIQATRYHSSSEQEQHAARYYRDQIDGLYDQAEEHWQRLRQGPS